MLKINKLKKIYNSQKGVLFGIYMDPSDFYWKLEPTTIYVSTVVGEEEEEEKEKSDSKEDNNDSSHRNAGEIIGIIIGVIIGICIILYCFCKYCDCCATHKYFVAIVHYEEYSIN